MDTKRKQDIESSIWETLYVIMSCFSKESGHASCESLQYFYKSLSTVLVFPEIRQFLNFYLVKNPISDYLYCDLKTDDIKIRLKWTVDLKNSYNKKYNPNIPADNLDKVLEIYNPYKITKRFWGNIIWKFIHYQALYQPNNLSEEQKYYFKQMMSALAFLLPCKLCRNHLKEHLHEFPINSYLSTNIEIFRWTFILHNRVNKSTGKSVLSYEQAIKLYL